MKKITNSSNARFFSVIISSLIIFSISAPIALADVIANPISPYNASEIVTVCEKKWTSAYDKINEDLNNVSEVARNEWSEDAMVAQFDISCADGTENGYSFAFMNKNETSKIYKVAPMLNDKTPWNYEETDNTENLLFPLSNINLTLRKLIPAMQKDPRLISSLDKHIDEESNTSMFITLKTDANHVSTWYIEFQVSGATPETNKTYLAWVSAQEDAKPLFKIVRKK